LKEEIKLIRFNNQVVFIHGKEKEILEPAAMDLIFQIVELMKIITPTL
jgi:hypothetical protein